MSSKPRDTEKPRREIPGDQEVYCLGTPGSSRFDVHPDRTCKFIADREDDELHRDDRGQWPDAKLCPSCAGTIEPTIDRDSRATRRKLSGLNPEDAGLSPLGAGRSNGNQS